MFTLNEIIAIVIIHWLADFIMQDEKWALGKSKNWNDLLSHTFTYSLLWWLLLIFLPSFIVVKFIIITFITHTITDYFTSRIVSKKFENKQYGTSIPNVGGFTIIGFDQVLHYVQLFATYYYLMKWKRKDSYSKKEVENILLKLMRERIKFSSYNFDEMEVFYKKWIEENL